METEAPPVKWASRLWNGDSEIMPYIAEFEPSETSSAKSAAAGWQVGRGITPGFNLALFAYASLSGLFRFFLSGQVQNATMEGLVLSIGLDFVRVLVTLTIAAAFLQAFWGRLITSIAPVRPLDFQEAVAVVLMTSILFGS
jgi:hypothetical protein